MLDALDKKERPEGIQRKEECNMLLLRTLSNIWKFLCIVTNEQSKMAVVNVFISNHPMSKKLGIIPVAVWADTTEPREWHTSPTATSTNSKEKKKNSCLKK